MSARIGLASIDGSYVDQHFGAARYWQIYELGEEAVFIETRKTRPGCKGHCEGGFDAVLEVLEDCDALFSPGSARRRPSQCCKRASACSRPPVRWTKSSRKSSGRGFWTT